MGPINKLQNALSFNYFANTQVYDPRADYIAKKPTLSFGPLEGQFENPLVPGTTPTSFTQGEGYTTPDAYKIVDGISYAQYVKNLNNKLTSELINENELANSQVKQEEAVNAGTQNIQPPPTPPAGDIENDKKVINGFNFDSYSKIDETETEDLDIKFQFVFQPVRDTKVDVTKTYRGKLYIQNYTTKEKKLIDKVKVSPNNATTVNFELESDNGVLVDLDNKVKFIFSARVSIQGDEPLVSFIKTAYAGNDSSLILEWETGAKVNYGFSKTIAS
jgi:hypothetical protein